MGQASQTFSDDFGHMTRHILGLDFRVGPDTPLIQLYRLARSKASLGQVMAADISVDEIMATGALGKIHVVDVSAEQPENFFFRSYAPKIRIALNDDMTGRRLVSTSWSALREFGLSDYHRIKMQGAPELSQVDLKAAGRICVNRRLVVPLTGDRGQVSHLLVALVTDQQDVVPHSLQ